MATSVDDLTEAMKDVIDPELGINVIDLQLHAHCKMLLRIKLDKYWQI